MAHSSSPRTAYIGVMTSVPRSPQPPSASASPKAPPAFKIVYFDVQSTSFSSAAEVIQLAARYQDREYSAHIMPKKEIPDEVADLTGLFISKQQMLDSYNKCQPVPAVSKKVAVDNFLKFLRPLGDNIILVAYNGLHFDARMLCGLISETERLDDFKKVVAGFSEALGLFRKKLKDRQDDHAFKLKTLAKDFLRQKHKTLDSAVQVKWLQKLANDPRINISQADLVEIHKPAETVIGDYIESRRKHDLRKDLEILKSTVSEKGEFVGLEDDTIDRLVEQGIGLHDLYWNWKHGGEEYVGMMISEPMEDEDGKTVPAIAEDEETVQMIMDNLAVVFKHGIMSILGVAAIARGQPFPFLPIG